MTDSTERFTDRVDDYVRARPGYPPALIALWLERGLEPGDPVADLGSGTGLLSVRLLEAGLQVYAVEPNEAMRNAAEAAFEGREGFVSLSGTAETTGLPDASVVAVVAGQAFHWFDPAAAREEALRILRPGGFASVVWNNRQVDADAFHAGYEALLVERGIDYQKVSRRWGRPLDLDTFFGAAGYDHQRLDNQQVLDWEGLRARLLSSSYTPGADDPRRAPMVAALRDLFDAHANAGRVVVRYHTDVFSGPLRSDG